jgi:hypothetical protein
MRRDQDARRSRLPQSEFEHLQSLRLTRSTIMENPGPACLRCVGLDDLALLPAGDALLTRRAKARGVRHAVVVRFSRTRRRYERQGLLVEPHALADAERELDGERAASDGRIHK